MNLVGVTFLSYGVRLLMKRKWFLYLLLVACIVGCTSTASTNPNDYVGEYVFKPSNVSPGAFASFLILKKDQSAVEIRFSKDTGEVQTTRKEWHLAHTTGENLVLGDFSHPIEGTSSTTKLVINGDLGQYYEKVR